MGMRMQRMLAQLLGIFAVAALAPQLASADSTGAISGTVENAAGGLLSNVEVQLYDLDNGNFSDVLTGSGGTYTASGLTPGRYQVYFSPPAGENYVNQYYPDKPNSAAAQPVLVASGQTTLNINATLATGAIVSGRVTDGAGNPVSGTFVNVYDYGGQQPSGVSNTGVFTDSNGRWSVEALPTGTYEAEFSPPNGSNYAVQYYNDVSGQDPPTPITLTAGSTTSDINAALTPGGQISGTVTDGTTNGPAAGVGVEAVDAMGYEYSNTTTDSQGHYTLPALSTSTSYRVEFFPAQGSSLASEFYPGVATDAAATLVPVTVGQTTQNIDQTLSAGGSISGVVTAAATGYPIAGVPVTLTDDAGQQVANASDVDTAADGTYDLTNLPPGSYKVQFAGEGALAFQYYNDASTLSGASSVNLSAGQAITNIDAALTEGGTLKGVVTDPSTGQPAPDVYVDVLDAQDNLVTSGYTDPSGHYEISGIAPGSYYVEALDFSGSIFFGRTLTARVGFYGGSTLSTAAPVTISEGTTTTGIDLALASRSATIPGVSTQSTGPATPVVTTTPPPPSPPAHQAQVIAGPPRVLGGSVSGLGKDKPVIKFRLVSGSNGGHKLRSFKVKLPAGLSFVAAQLARGVKVTGGGKVTEKVTGGQLVVTLASPAKALTVSISSPALQVSTQLTAKAARKKAGTLRVTVTVTPVNQQARMLSFTVKNPG